MTRNTILFLLVVLTLGACKLPYPTYNYKPTGDPYIKLKTGETVTGERVKQKFTFLGREKFQVDDKVYLAKDIAEYQDTKSRNVNLGKKDFAEQIVKSKINLYRQTVLVVSSDGHTSSSHQEILDYIQGGDTGKIVGLSYKALRPLIPEHARGNDALVKYQQVNKQRRIVRIALWSAIGGSIIACVATKGSTGAFTALGTATLVGGLGFIYNIIRGGHNSVRLYQALDAYDGLHSRSKD